MQSAVANENAATAMPASRSIQAVFSWVVRSAAVAFALFIAPFSVMTIKTYDTDPDIWWHIRVGDWIAAHHSWPHTSIFSQRTVPWSAYSWGFDLLVSRANHLFGLPGIPGLLICLEILIGFTLLITIRRIAGSFWPAWWIGTAAICTCYLNPLRPSLLTLFFFVLELFVIFESERREDDGFLYWTAPLVIVWANCHIQFIYGIAVLGLYVAARITAIFWARSTGEARVRGSVAGMIGLLALALACTCIGPYGIRLYSIAATYGGQTFVYQIIQEMHAMDFRQPMHYFVLALALAACFLAGRSSRRDLFRPALLALTALVSFRLQRDVWFVSAASAFVIAEAARDRLAAKEATGHERSDRVWLVAPYVAGVAVAVALSFAFAIHEGISAAVMIGEIDRVYPIRATEFIRDARLQGPMYNSFNWGGFLIFNLPEYPVSTDPRTDVYGDNGVRRSIATTDAVDWQNDPNLARANFVIIERYFPLAKALANDPAYNLAYQDQLAVVFVKKNPSQ